MAAKPNWPGCKPTDSNMGFRVRRRAWKMRPLPLKMSHLPLEGARLNRFLSLLCFTALLPLAATAGAAPGARPTYKWVDKDGVVHYGDHIPPEYAGQEQHII